MPATCEACGRELPAEVYGTCATCRLTRSAHERDVLAFLAGREVTS
jgi:hypothetical protein